MSETARPSLDQIEPVVNGVFSRIKQSFDAKSGIHLAQVDVTCLASSIRGSIIPLTTPPADTKLFIAILQKISAVQDTLSGGLDLTAREVEALHYTTFRISIYLPNHPTLMEDDLKEWHGIYRKTYLDGTHCLDYQWDISKDYSTTLPKTSEESRAMNSWPCFQMPGSREQFAKEYYLCGVSSVWKLMDAQSRKASVTLSIREARSAVAFHRNDLLDFSKSSTSCPKRPSNDEQKNFIKTTNTRFLNWKNIIIATEKHDNVTLTHEEVSLCLETLEDFPFPQPRPSSKPSADTPYHGDQKQNIIALEMVKDQDPMDSVTELEARAALKAALQRELRQREEIIKLSEENINLVKVAENVEEAKYEMKQSQTKKLTAKDREMTQKESEMKHLRDSSHNREQTFKNEISKLESNLVSAKEDLNKALKLPDKLRDEWFAKIQRLHDKVSKLEKELKAEVDTHEITKRDGKETVKKLEAMEFKMVRFKEEQKRFAIKANEIISERNELRAARVSQAQLNDTKASEISRAVEAAVKPLQDTVSISEAKIASFEGTIATLKDTISNSGATIASLEILTAKLQNEARIEMHKEGVAAIHDLDNLKVKYKTLSDDLVKESHARVQDATSWNSLESHMRGQIIFYQSTATTAERENCDLQRQLKEEHAVSVALRYQIGQQQPNALVNQIVEMQNNNARLERENSQFKNLLVMMQNVGRS